MRISLCILIILASLSGVAGTGIDLKQQYKIVSDHVDTSLAVGTCMVMGTVKYGNIPVENGLVGATVGMNDTTTDTTGFYTLSISDSDSIVYFYKPFYSEIAISPYDFKSQHVVVIDFYASEKVIHEEMKKPVIYFYPEETLNVTTSLAVNGELTFTYPEIRRGWDFTVQPDGTLCKDNRRYPYLFWEGTGENVKFERDSEGLLFGHLVAATDVIEFLETRLTSLGLNDKEKTDFITYWGPKMIQHELTFVQFQFNEAVSNMIGEIEVTPSPDHLHRVYMLITDGSKLIGETAEQSMPSKLDRSGFTVLEWGGTVIAEIRDEH